MNKDICSTEYLEHLFFQNLVGKYFKQHKIDLKHLTMEAGKKIIILNYTVKNNLP